MTRVDGEPPVLLVPLTKPAQPLKNAAEQLSIAALTAHTNPFTLVFTVCNSSGLKSACRPGTGVGPLRLKLHSGLNYMRRIDSQREVDYWFEEQFWGKFRTLTRTVRKLP
jgi:hypothetical protein